VIAADLVYFFIFFQRTSQQFIDGLSVAQGEYDLELAARRDAEAEITRLRVQLSGQAARLTALSAEGRRRDLWEQMSKDMNANLHNLERETAKIKTERDIALAEFEELSSRWVFFYSTSHARSFSILVLIFRIVIHIGIELRRATCPLPW